MPARVDVLSGAKEGQTFYFDKRRLLVGTDVSCDIVLDTVDSVAHGRCAAEVMISPDGCSLVNTGSGDVSVNGAVLRAGTRRAIRSGDLIGFSSQGPHVRFLIVPRMPDDHARHFSGTAVDALPARGTALLPASVGGYPFVLLPVAAGAALCLLAATCQWWRTAESASPRMVAAQVPVATVALDEGSPSVVAGASTITPPVERERADQPATGGGPARPAEAVPHSKMDAAAVALIGEVDGVKLPWCSGWVCGPRQVATSAPMAGVLQEVMEAGGDVFVFVDSGALVRVARFRQHPTYTAEGPLSAAVAVAETTEPLPLPPPHKLSGDLPHPLLGVRVEVVGYEIPQQDDESTQAGRFAPKPYNKLDPPRLTRTPGRIVSIRSITAAPRDLPLLQIDLRPPPGCDGGAVVDETGAVIGTLLTMKSDDALYVVLCDHLDDL